jgi:hypothetical protein
MLNDVRYKTQRIKVLWIWPKAAGLFNAVENAQLSKKANFGNP